MEEFFYIILLVIWLVVSLYKRGAKSKQQKSKPAGQPDQTTSMPKESELEEMLEEFFGGGKKKKKEQPGEEVLSDQEVVHEYEELLSKQASKDEPRRHEEPQPSYQAWESRAQQSYNEKKQKSQETAGEPSYEESYKVQAEALESYTAMEKVASVDDLIRSHAAKDAMEQARAEMEQGGGLGDDLPEFDLRTAVIFSEILNRKYT